jgi:4-hydroxy-3-polyprenylbenzoate decarboxylase
MAYEHLGEFISLLERSGELKRIKVEVDPYLEISHITDRVSKSYGPALLFERVKGSDIPVLTNTFGSYKRMALALAVESLEEISQKIESLLEVDIPKGFFSKLRLLPKYARLIRFLPEVIKKGSCQEKIHLDHPSFDQLPILQYWPKDGGRYLTATQVFTKSLEDGRRNVGMYRMQIYGAQHAGLHCHLHHDGFRIFRQYQEAGKPMEVAVALGGDPAVMYAASAPMPWGMDELILAGFLRNKKVELVKCKTINLEVPANADIVLEGYVDPKEWAEEGPFGDHTGYYSPPDNYPVFHLTAITHREKPIYPAILVGRPPMEDVYLGKATERIFLPLIKAQLPEIVDLNLPIEGGFHNLAIVSIRKEYPFHARKVMHGLWGLGQLMFMKIIIVVDEEVDVHNWSEVIWKVGNSIDPRRDICFIDGPVDVLDHASYMPMIGSKMGIDATKKLKEEGYERLWPEEARMSPEIIQLVEKRWKEYGFGR